MYKKNLKNDLSFFFYEKYFLLSNPEVEITLKNQTVLKGKINGYFYGDIDHNAPFIDTWHITHSDNFLGNNSTDYSEGDFVSQKDIVSVFFLDDKTRINFHSL